MRPRRLKETPNVFLDASSVLGVDEKLLLHERDNNGRKHSKWWYFAMQR